MSWRRAGVVKMDEFTHGLAIQSNRHCTREVKKRMPAFSGPDAAQPVT